MNKADKPTKFLDSDFDLLIVGGGMVGTSLAVALENTSFKIGLVEAKALQTNSQPNFDDRAIALSYGSQRIFQGMGLWSEIAPYATAIKHIHISDRGHFGVTRLSADKQQVPALGQVVTARELGRTLNQRLQSIKSLKLFCPAQVTQIEQLSDHVNVSLDNGETLRSRLLVAADGRNSTIRHLLKLGAWQQTYEQTAVTTNISTDRPHLGWAYERFTNTGPMALLPMAENRSSLVWTVKSGDEDLLLDLPDAEFLDRLQQCFGHRAGRFIRVGQRHRHPLVLMQSDMPIQQRIVFIGNSAHSLHPIAGQGFNLGLRDVAVLADCLVDADEDCGNMVLLQHYQNWRQKDHKQVVYATDKLVKLFSNDISLLGHLRGAGLALLDIMPAVKNLLAERSMGLGQKQPRLGRGIRL